MGGWENVLSLWCLEYGCRRGGMMHKEYDTPAGLFSPGLCETRMVGSTTDRAPKSKAAQIVEEETQ